MTLSKNLKYSLSTLSGMLIVIILWYVSKVLVSFLPITNITVKTIHYPIHSESSRSAENWFYNYEGGFEANKHYVVETCQDIKDSYVTYEWEYESTCNKVGVITK